MRDPNLPAYHRTIIRGLTAQGLDPEAYDTAQIEERMRDRQPNGCLDHLEFNVFSIEAAIAAEQIDDENRALRDCIEAADDFRLFGVAGGVAQW